MKKLFALLLAIFVSGTAHAGLISVATLSNDSQVSYQTINTANNTIKNCINGNIESINIKDGTIVVTDMASSSSPAQREGDHFNAYTKSGMLPVTATGLTSDISAGTSYVKSDAGLMYRVVTAATSKTYTATKDTWVYIDTNGAFQYVEQAIGTAQPTTPSNSLLLAKVVTDGTDITTVTDHRVTSISLGEQDDKYIKGLNLLWTATDRLSVDSGVTYVGSSRVAKTTATGLNVGTAGDYVTGVSERGTSKWIYVYAKSDGSIKLDDTAPSYHDYSGTTVGTKYYLKDASDNYWRILGRIRLDATGSGDVLKFRMVDDMFYNTTEQVVAFGTQSAFTEVDITGVTSPIDAEVYFYTANTSGAAGTLALRSGGDLVDTYQNAVTFVVQNARYAMGPLPVEAGPTYARSVFYKVSNGDTDAGYVKAVRLAR